MHDTQSAAGPAQQVVVPALTQMQPCSQTPPLQMSTVQPFESSQSALVAHVGGGCGNVVVVVVTDDAHDGVHS